MQFRARLDRRSHIWREWNGAGRPISTLAGVTFRWTPGNIYVSDVLTADQLTCMQAHECVEIEVAAMAMPAGHAGAHGHTAVPPAAPVPEPPPARVDPLAGQLPARAPRADAAPATTWDRKGKRK